MILLAFCALLAIGCRGRVFGMGFGPPKSFMEAQIEALEKVDGELLFDSVRYDARPGVALPFGTLISLFLPSFGITDIPVVVQEIWYVQGMAAHYTGPRAPLPAD